MNDSDTEANTKAIDSLLNFETVKYFGNEELEARRFDASMARYEQAAIKTFRSLGLLNTGQALIFTVGMTACMLLAARGIVAGGHTIGEFVMINVLLLQLYMPLNFMGMVYREIKQGLVDLEVDVRAARRASRDQGPPGRQAAGRRQRCRSASTT